LAEEAEEDKTGEAVEELADIFHFQDKVIHQL
jgi:hypothetical protein